MTSQKRAAIRKLIERQTLLKTASKDVAREFLVRSGIYTEDGNLSASFGGSAEPSRDPRAARQVVRKGK